MASSSSSSSSSSTTRPLSFLPTPALDHALAGITAGAIATVCMQPLDLIKTQFQVRTDATRHTSSQPRGWRHLATGGNVGRDMWRAWSEIVRRDGARGLYRGLSPNVVGNSASWGLYFLWYTMIKEYMAAGENGGANKKLSAGQHLLAASESGAATALLTNPIWVVKTRMFTTSLASATSNASTTLSSTAIASPPHAAPASTHTHAAPTAYRGLWHGLRDIWQHEGVRGLYKGAGLALVGVSNGAIQFVAYEELKRWRSGLRQGEEGEQGSLVQLSNTEYIILSGLAKLLAIGLTYPYQVVRSRMQNHATTHVYPNIPTCVRLTYAHEGMRGFYKGLAPNAVRIIPGTCVTFVVYENMSWALRRAAERKEERNGVETARLVT